MPRTTSTQPEDLNSLSSAALGSEFTNTQPTFLTQTHTVEFPWRQPSSFLALDT